jgi:microcystin degradation protein MlrC
MVLGGGNTVSFLSPMRGVFRALRALEEDRRVVSASLFMVHPYTTAEHLGWAVHVCTDGDARLADELADRFADRVWEERKSRLPTLLTVPEAIGAARESLASRLGPVTFVDCDDVVGAGAPGGNTRIAAGLLAHGRDLRAFVPLHDPRLVEELWDVTDGTTRAVVLRGTPGYGAPEVRGEALVAAHATNEFGRLVRLDFVHPEGGALHVVASDSAPLPIHPSFWEAVGLRARDARVIVQKNFFHYRMFYATTSFRHLPVVSGGATSFDEVVNAEYVVPMEPATSLSDWRSADPILKQPRRGWKRAPEDAGRPRATA